MRRRPLVFLLVRPRSKGSTGDSVAITATKGKTTRRRKEKEIPREKVQCAGKSLWIGCRILVDRWSRKSMPSPPPPQRSLAYGPFSLLKGAGQCSVSVLISLLVLSSAVKSTLGASIRALALYSYIRLDRRASILPQAVTALDVRSLTS